MAAPEPGGPAGSLEFLGTILIGILGLGAQAWRYIKESSKDEPQPRHMVLEAAELTDMTAIRAALLKLDKLMELKADIDELREADARILEILERLDRAEEIAKGVREGILQEQLRGARR